MKRIEINKKHGMVYKPKTMLKAITKAGIKFKPGMDFSDAEVAKIDAVLAKLPKDKKPKK